MGAQDGAYEDLQKAATLRASLGLTRPGPCLTPEGPSTQLFRSLVRNTIKSMVFGTRNLHYWVLGPSGDGI